MKAILIIEDEQNLVDLLKFRLEANDYKVEVAFDGKDGLEKIRRLKPGLVILDVMMPKMHGYEVCRISKKEEATKDIPILMLTARAQAKDMEEAKRAGADACIAKPFESAELLAEIKRLLKA